MDLFDRRFHVYKEVQNIFGIVLSDANISYEKILEFRRNIPEAEFLFGDEVAAYIVEIHRRGVQLNYFRQQYRDSTQPYLEGYDHEKVVEGAHAESLWFLNQFEPSKKIFRKYLDVSR